MIDFEIGFYRLAQMVKGLLAFGIFITHGLACYVAIDITWNDYIGKRFGNSPRKLLWEYTVRTLLVLVTFLLAVAIPNLELFISLFGAFCLSALGLAFPAVRIHFFLPQNIIFFPYINNLLEFFFNS